jgi:site-specific DNA-cytosine methylase
LQANELDSQESEVDSSLRQPESLTLFSEMEAGFSLRMFPDSFPHKAEEISESFSRRWPNSGFMTSPGECWTVDTSECRSDGGVSSSLPDVLEADVPPRFYLSQRAAAGILRRAEKRGRELPPHLNSALRTLSMDSEGEQTTTQPKQTTSSLTPCRQPQETIPEQMDSIWSSVRRLTPTECERLQGFPDGWTVP